MSTTDYRAPERTVEQILEEARQPGRYVFAAPFAVPRTVCPGCGETMEPGRTVEYQPPEYPGGSQAECFRHVLWHTQCAVLAIREAPDCSVCEERHVLDGACLL